MRGLPLLFVALLSTSVFSFDTTYAAYGALLRSHVCDGGVAYDALRKDPRILRQCDSLFSGMTESAYRQLADRQKIAFLVNLYNYVTIRVIVENLPLRTGIRDIRDVWKRPFVPLFGRTVSLDHVEHEMLRKQFAEPRIHFVLVCASKGCPVLPAAPLRGDSLDMQMDAAARAFLTDPGRNRVDGKGRVVLLGFRAQHQCAADVDAGQRFHHIGAAFGT